MIEVGELFPDVTLKALGPDGLEDLRVRDLLAGKNVIVFSLPGAFTPTCSAKHLPGYVAKAEEIRATGIDEVFCLAVNDPHVMRAWSADQGAEGKVTMLPDGNGELTEALGLLVDMGGGGLGRRGIRASMTVRDGVVTSLEVEPGRGVEVSGADACLVRRAG